MLNLLLPMLLNYRLLWILSEGSCLDSNPESKPSKCRTIAFRIFRKGEKQKKYRKLQLSQYSSYDPLIKINGNDIKFADPPTFKYLGLIIQADLKDNIVKSRWKRN